MLHRQHIQTGPAGSYGQRFPAFGKGAADRRPEVAIAGARIAFPYQNKFRVAGSIAILPGISKGQIITLRHQKGFGQHERRIVGIENSDRHLSLRQIPGVIGKLGRCRTPVEKYGPGTARHGEFHLPVITAGAGNRFYVHIFNNEPILNAYGAGPEKNTPLSLGRGHRLPLAKDYIVAFVLRAKQAEAHFEKHRTVGQ